MKIIQALEFLETYCKFSKLTIPNPDPLTKNMITSIDTLCDYVHTVERNKIIESLPGAQL
jgi:hypothetical protein